MSDIRQAAQQALEALEYHVEQTRPIHKTSEAITALRAALAEPDVPEVCFGNMSDTLPPLPVPAQVATYDKQNGHRFGMYSADQMHAYAAVAEPCAIEIERLKALSVTKILLDVAPGEDGMGCEVYAKSVDQVVDKLTELGQAVEDMRATRTPQPAAPPQREPLTDEQIGDLIPFTNRGHNGAPSWGLVDMVWFARAIERAHGISAPASAPKEQ